MIHVCIDMPVYPTCPTLPTYVAQRRSSYIHRKQCVLIYIEDNFIKPRINCIYTCRDVWYMMGKNDLPPLLLPSPLPLCVVVCCLEPDLSRRPSCASLLRHPFVQKALAPPPIFSNPTSPMSNDG
jgi:serine/threonine protein kinase